MSKTNGEMKQVGKRNQNNFMVNHFIVKQMSNSNKYVLKKVVVDNHKGERTSMAANTKSCVLSTLLVSTQYQL